MLKYRSSLGIAPFLAVLLLLFPMQSWSAELPEGMSVKVLAEFPSEIPGIKKVVLKEMRLEPGAKKENYVVGSTTFCTVLEGEITIVSGGKTEIKGTGSKWVVPKGTKIQGIYNNGSRPHVQHIWALVPSK